MKGEIQTDGKTLWINDKFGCVLRINCMDALKEDNVPIAVDIKLIGTMTDVTR